MPLQFNINFNLNRGTLTCTGIAGLLILLGLCALPQLFAVSLDAERAKIEIHTFLRQDLANRHFRELQATGSKTPDHATAQNWDDAFKRLYQTELVSVRIGHFLFLPPFSSSRMFIVKAVIRLPDGREETRCFSLSARSKLFDVFLVAEQPLWMWTFAF